jgi:hypothetical protein
MRKFFLLTLICFLGLQLLLVNQNTAQEAPVLTTSDYVGSWSGTTSQGFPISLEIEDLRGHAVVTKLGYKITLEGMAWGWSKTSDMLIPRSIVAYVMNNKFHFTGYFLDNPIEITGEFVTPTQIQGSLKESNVFPGGVVTAKGDVTYVATRE